MASKHITEHIFQKGLQRTDKQHEKRRVTVFKQLLCNQIHRQMDRLLNALLSGKSECLEYQNYCK